MKLKREEYYCDKCGKKLKSCDNEVELVTSVNESSYWSRLHIQFKHIHGMHNDGTTDTAELCKNCTVELLTDALKRVKSGERVSAGVNNSEMEKW